jgi:hypothetical protein
MIVKKAVAERGAKTKHGSSTAPSRRPHGIKLADVFLWITVVDECQHHPRGAFERAAISEGFKSEGNVQHRLLVLETLFRQLFLRSPPKKRKERSEEEKSHPTRDMSTLSIRSANRTRAPRVAIKNRRLEERVLPRVRELRRGYRLDFGSAST